MYPQENQEALTGSDFLRKTKIEFFEPDNDKKSLSEIKEVSEYSSFEQSTR